MQYRYVTPSSHFVRNGVSLDFRVASLLKIQFAWLPIGELPRWGAKNVLPLNLLALLIGGSFFIPTSSGVSGLWYNEGMQWLVAGD